VQGAWRRASFNHIRLRQFKQPDVCRWHPAPNATRSVSRGSWACRWAHAPQTRDAPQTRTFSHLASAAAFLRHITSPCRGGATGGKVCSVCVHTHKHVSDQGICALSMCLCVCVCVCIHTHSARTQTHTQMFEGKKTEEKISSHSGVRTSRCQCRRRLEVCDGRPHRLHVLWRTRSCSTRALLTQPRCRSGTAPHCIGRQGVSSVFRA